uniref:Rho-GAP domain-containing protein n=1 Tax=Castor canadensis TaxID=51338 RepID=A0A8C0XHA5_CASCN
SEKPPRKLVHCDPSKMWSEKKKKMVSGPPRVQEKLHLIAFCVCLLSLTIIFQGSSLYHQLVPVFIHFQGCIKFHIYSFTPPFSWRHQGLNSGLRPFSFPFRYLIKFLSKLSEYQDVNKMTPSNMAIVLGPNLLWPQAEGNITEMMTTVSLQIVGIIEPIIQHADWFFPGEIEFNITGNYGSPVHVNHNANYSSMPSPDMDPADRRQPEQARRPLSVATDNMMLEFYKKDGMGVRVMDTSWVARRGSSAGRKASCAPPSMQPPAPPAELAAPLPSPLLEQTPDSPVVPALSPSGMGLQPTIERPSSSKSKELSPGSGQKGSPGSSQGTACPGTQPGPQPVTPSQPPADQSPHSLRKVSKKLAPIPPKVPFGQPGAVTDQSAGQPSPVSLSPTPPSTPSPYGLSYPPGYSLASGQLSPAAAPPLASPSIFTSTLAKSRPTPKPRQRPTLPPPQPPTVSLSASSPQSTEHPILDGMSPGESMSTGNLARGSPEPFYEP